ncbi:MAG: hypothetical protein JW841_07670 [Deltaproteobacteria bacterium]|nr:hypothetical protein [Deltaproteobacteria bacterium]
MINFDDDSPEITTEVPVANVPAANVTANVANVPNSVANDNALASSPSSPSTNHSSSSNTSTTDLLDEVLQQISELTLRTNNIDTAIKTLDSALSDVGETTHTGLVEIRGLLANNGEAQPQKSLTGINERFELLEVMLAKIGNRQRMFIGLLIAAIAIGVINAIAIFSFGFSQETDISFTPPVSTNAAEIPALTPTTSSPNSSNSDDGLVPAIPSNVPSLDPVKRPGRPYKGMRRHNRRR